MVIILVEPGFDIVFDNNLFLETGWLAADRKLQQVFRIHKTWSHSVENNYSRVINFRLKHTEKDFWMASCEIVKNIKLAFSGINNGSINNESIQWLNFSWKLNNFE